MTKFTALTDDEIRGNSNASPISRDDLIIHYRELRDRHVAETALAAKRDRSAILRMAGNIAGGLMADPGYEAETPKDVAERDRKSVV